MPDWVVSCAWHGTAGQRIKDDKHELKWTGLSRHESVDNGVPPRLSSLAYHLAESLPRQVLPRSVKY